MDGLKQVAQFPTTSDDGRQHIVYVYHRADSGHGKGSPLFITSEGWEAAPIRDGVFRVYGTGLILKSDLAIAR